MLVLLVVIKRVPVTTFGLMAQVQRIAYIKVNLQKVQSYATLTNDLIEVLSSLTTRMEKWTRVALSRRMAEHLITQKLSLMIAVLETTYST